MNKGSSDYKYRDTKQKERRLCERKKKEIEKEIIRQRRRERIKLSTSICHGFAHTFCCHLSQFFCKIKKEKA